ncbi:hypothetical protein BDQ12DRAFT_668374 [Crucibulum laeve]|uniref:Uncharacterized protein n=1 Tax=Crucibulum laeve TaxID=68775 RepID=A0A5C3LSJ9_9AGAR|nr:hypothetical protein BDQ12DRAFT_668374 [Crucibulum laeve]
MPIASGCLYTNMQQSLEFASIDPPPSGVFPIEIIRTTTVTTVVEEWPGYVDTSRKKDLSIITTGQQLLANITSSSDKPKFRTPQLLRSQASHGWENQQRPIFESSEAFTQVYSATQANEVSEDTFCIYKQSASQPDLSHPRSDPQSHKGSDVDSASLSGTQSLSDFLNLPADRSPEFLEVNSHVDEESHDYEDFISEYFDVRCARFDVHLPSVCNEVASDKHSEIIFESSASDLECKSEQSSSITRDMSFDIDVVGSENDPLETAVQLSILGGTFSTYHQKTKIEVFQDKFTYDSHIGNENENENEIIARANPYAFVSAARADVNE